MIEIKNVSKTYPKAERKALDNVSLRIETGEFFGILGPNGAGKTTLISILSTLLLPGEGKILIDGEELTRSRSDVKKKIALITQHNSLRRDMTVDEVMELQARLYGLELKKAAERSGELLKLCGLGNHRKKTAKELSGGMKKKLMLCRALLTEPQILILDEPTTGLDPASRRQIWDLLRGLNRQGITVLLTTHCIDEAQYLCQRIALIDNGKVAKLSTPDELISELGEIAVDEFLEEGTKSAFFKEREKALEFASKLEARFMIRNTTLEDVFIHVVGKGLGAK